MPYIGRFAPSPTGPLHLGSLAAALGSCLEARRHGGLWFLRMEDLDPPREMPGAAAGILRTLERLCFRWDGEVVYQSRRHDAYAAAADKLFALGAAFPCACTRSEIADSGLAGLEGPIYPGTCRRGLPPGKSARALRLRVPDESLHFEDALQGEVWQDLARDIGDFIIRRADGCCAYQLAVVVDDAWAGITHVVRGADLLLSTPRQLYLQTLLGLPHPRYMHLPVAVNVAGEKLSKQTHAPPVDELAPGVALWRALQFLLQQPPETLQRASIEEIWTWAEAHWNPDALRGRRSLPVG
ncbi:MAG TPA: tRNA glutamyl-Q(34) synthetase GluQRS [Gammaproteobacteria bacterium]|nr:tRNA glutamyl-Q(34) synthetase GluQRS [Gammaproteobacteria bacterium]